MDYEDVANVSNFAEDVTPSQSLHYIFHEVVFTIFCIVGIFADAAIVFTIFRFRGLRTKENIFLANWALADLFSLIVTPSGYRILSVIGSISLSSEFTCSLFHLGSTLHLTAVLFVIVVSIDWFIGAYFEKTSEKLRSYYRYIIGSVWMFSLLMSGLTVGYCLDDEFTAFPNYLLLASVIGFMIIIIVLQSSRAVKKYFLKKPLDHPTLKLTLTTSFLGCWILAFLTLIVMGLARLHPAIAIIAECLIFASSIVNLTLLYRLDEEFRACLLQALKRSSQKNKESACSFDNPIVKNRNGKDSVEVSFDNPNDGLIDNMY